MVAGNNTESLLGVCESMWRPDMVGSTRRLALFSCPSPLSLARWDQRPALSIRTQLCTLINTRRCPQRVMRLVCLTQLYHNFLPLPAQESEQLFEVISQCLLSACNRDCLSGWGGIVHVMCAPRSTNTPLCF